jgi:hypothetical protein
MSKCFYVNPNEMVGQTFTSVVRNGDEIWFENDKVRYVFYHSQDCCETVYIDDIIGDLEDLENLPLLIAREDTNIEDPGTCTAESYTWTFYTLATFKGYVTIRFLGESNGYYSESVSVKKYIK